MNVRVHNAVSDTQGSTGMAIIRRIVAGERDPQKLAQLRDSRCHKSKAQIAEFLTGHWRSDHLFNLEHSLKVYDAIAEQVAVYEGEIQQRMKQLTPQGREEEVAPQLANTEKMKGMKRRGEEERRQALYRMVGVDLTTIDGVGVETAEAIVSEYGTDLSKFATEKQFVAHLKLAPRQVISGGKPVLKPGKKPTKTKGTRAGQALRNAAMGVRRSLSALGAYYRRISHTKGAQVAVFATARKLATLMYLDAALGASLCGHWSRAIRRAISPSAAPLVEQHCRPVRLRPRAQTSASNCLNEQEVSDEIFDE